MTSPHSIRDVVAQMIAVVPEDALSDLQDEDPASAVEVHFEPVRVHQLPRASIRGEDCSVDGYYEVFIDPDRPRILYSNDVVPERARFTIIHELGHHIFNTTGAWLLDDLDRIGGSALGAHRAEEAACHRFAGEVLVPTGLLDDIVGSDALTPKHVVWLRETTNASWEALAVRAANYSGTTTAVALVRSSGEVSFATANGLPPWPRGSRVQPDGPLDRSLRHRSTKASPEVYRYGMGGAATQFGSTQVSQLQSCPPDAVMVAYRSLSLSTQLGRSARSSAHGAMLSVMSAGAMSARAADVVIVNGVAAPPQSTTLSARGATSMAPFGLVRQCVWTAKPSARVE